MPALMIRKDVPPADVRRLAIAAALEGMSLEAAARIAGMDRQTLRDRVIRYNRGGPAGPSDHSGRRSALPADRRPTGGAEGDRAAGARDRRRLDLAADRPVPDCEGAPQRDPGQDRAGQAERSLKLSWQMPRPRHAETGRVRPLTGYAWTGPIIRYCAWYQIVNLCSAGMPRRRPAPN